MKTVLYVFFVLLLLVWFIFDYTLFFYGRNKLDVYPQLENRLIPDYWGYDQGNLGFVLKDEFEMVLIGKGIKSKQMDSPIQEVTQYSINNENIYIVVVNELGDTLDLCLTTDLNGIYRIDNCNHENQDDNLDWYFVMNLDRIENFEIIRRLAFILILILILGRIFTLVKNKL